MAEDARHAALHVHAGSPRERACFAVQRRQLPSAGADDDGQPGGQ